MKKNMLILLGLVIVIIINICFYNRLPDNIGLQVSASGGLNNYISKLLFVIIAPVVLLITYGYTLLKKEEINKQLYIMVVVVALNLILLFTNL